MRRKPLGRTRRRCRGKTKPNLTDIVPRELLDRSAEELQRLLDDAAEELYMPFAEKAFDPDVRKRAEEED